VLDCIGGSDVMNKGCSLLSRQGTFVMIAIGNDPGVMPKVSLAYTMAKKYLAYWTWLGPRITFMSGHMSIPDLEALAKFFA
jgi:hypothetical protein